MMYTLIDKRGKEYEKKGLRRIFRKVCKNQTDYWGNNPRMFEKNASLDIREELLSVFFNDINDFENFKCIFTSRPAYIDFAYFQNIIKLNVFNEEKIKAFCIAVTGNKLYNSYYISNNVEVLGIPVILYMAIMSKVDLSDNTTKPELYNRIFAEEGGIFDKFCSKGVGYDNGTQVLRDRKNIKSYLDFLQKVAFAMFEKNDLILLKDEYQSPEIKFQGGSMSILEFPIKHLFEGTESNIEFIHKSIYEYFASEYIFTKMCDVINNFLKEKLAGVFGNSLKSNHLSGEILEFLKYKFENNNPNRIFYAIKESFQIMLKNGMTYYTNMCHKNVIRCEMIVFENMLEILHLWNDGHFKFDSSICNYIKHNTHGTFNLKNADLRDIDLRGVDLKEADLSGTDLRGADLRFADLKEVDLVGANLRGANLSESNLRKADLRKAILIGADKVGDLTCDYIKYNTQERFNLKNADLREANLSKVDLKDADLIKADLSGANLSKADLHEAVLLGADIKGINLYMAYLEGAVFDDEQIDYLKSQYPLAEVKVYINRTKTVISYQEYEKIIRKNSKKNNKNK